MPRVQLVLDEYDVLMRDLEGLGGARTSSEFAGIPS